MAYDEKVGFLCVGAQKSGTTALFEYLKNHPTLQIPACKEVHFFDDEQNIDWTNPCYENYHLAFEPPDGRLRGEITPIYMYWPRSLERIRLYNPAMRLIMIFRNPVERAYSHWKMEASRSREDQPFSWAIRQGRVRVDDPAAPGHSRIYSYVERGFYAQQIERAQVLFPKEQFLFLRTDALMHDVSTTLDRVCDFLGVPRFAEAPIPLMAHVGPGPERFAPLSDEDRAYLRDLYAEDQARFTALTGLSV